MGKMGRLAGLCLVVMFAIGMTLAGTAQAKWEQCSEGGSATKDTTDQCTTASGTGKWEWNEVTGTEEVRIKGSVRITDTKVPLAGKVSVECFVEGIGHVGPGEHSRINEIKTSAEKCRNVEKCEKVEKSEARDVPWQAESDDAEGQALDMLTSAGSGEPGWKIECKVLGVTEADECLAESELPERVVLENKATGSELLVLARFNNEVKGKCSIGGAEAGEITGTLAILKTNGSGLRIGTSGLKAVFPHWYKGSTRLPGRPEAMATAVATGTGTAVFSITDVANKRQSICKMKDTGKIYNPESGVSGVGKITSATFTNCTSETGFCATAPELEARGTPWGIILFSGSPITVGISDMKLEIKCNGVSQGTYEGTVYVKIFTGPGTQGETSCTATNHTTWMEFVNTNELLSGANKGVLAGRDCIWEEAANGVIKALTP
jgi:hypothetical protein